MGLFNDIDPIFFYHKSVKPLLAMGFNGVVTPSAESLEEVEDSLKESTQILQTIFAASLLGGGNG
jgi:hypothetical protein